ncbi:hypothetical protein ACS0TY_033853 [Phlomoides rotata]
MVFDADLRVEFSTPKLSLWLSSVTEIYCGYQFQRECDLGDTFLRSSGILRFLPFFLKKIMAALWRASLRLRRLEIQSTPNLVMRNVTSDGMNRLPMADSRSMIEVFLDS